jgi:hypothetical protein
MGVYESTRRVQVWRLSRDRGDAYPKTFMFEPEPKSLLQLGLCFDCCGEKNTAADSLKGHSVSKRRVFVSSWAYLFRHGHWESNLLTHARENMLRRQRDKATKTRLAKKGNYVIIS